MDRSLAQCDSADESIRLHDLQLDYVRAQWPKADKEALKLIHGAIRLSSHVIVKDPGQFASQMVGRLLPYHDLAAIQQFVERLPRAQRSPGCRPLRPRFILRERLWFAPCTATLSVNGVAVTGDGKRAVSASGDKTLKVWDLETGRELRTLEGHSGDVHGVAVTADGKRAVSASEDKTLKVWDLESGRELRTLAGPL